MTNDIIEVIQERLDMLRERELICADECRVLKVLVDEIKQQYMKLPLGADGAPIRPGDKVVNNKTKIAGEVAAVSDSYIRFNNIAYGYLAGNFQHENPATIENLLEQFAAETVDIDERDKEEFGALLSEYAEKIKAVKE